MSSFSIRRPKRRVAWVILLAMVIILNVGIINGIYGLGMTLSTSDSISLVSADFLGLLVLLAVFPPEDEPDMDFVNVQYVRDVTVRHPNGEFQMRLFYVGVSNKAGIFAKAAKDVMVFLRFRMPGPAYEFGSPLPWEWVGYDDVRIKATIDSNSPTSIADELNKTIFKKRQLSFNPGDGVFAIVAFGLSTTGHVYSATEYPSALDRDVTHKEGEPPHRIQAVVALSLSSPDLPVPPHSKDFAIVGDSWNDATIQEVKVKGG